MREELDVLTQTKADLESIVREKQQVNCCQCIVVAVDGDTLVLYAEGSYLRLYSCI